MRAEAQSGLMWMAESAGWSVWGRDVGAKDVFIFCREGGVGVGEM